MQSNPELVELILGQIDKLMGEMVARRLATSKTFAVFATLQILVSCEKGGAEVWACGSGSGVNGRGMHSSQQGLTVLTQADCFTHTLPSTPAAAVK